MTDFLSKPCVAFAGSRLVVNGSLQEVALAAKSLETVQTEPVLVFDEGTGEMIELDLRGDPSDVLRRLQERRSGDSAEPGKPEPQPRRGRGRPKLGVVAREVTLLPRHWEWLGAQRGGASQVLRRLVDQARRADGGETRTRTAREAAYRFMTVMAGNLPGFEEAVRALFANDRTRFVEQVSQWPEDVRAYAEQRAFGD